MFSSAAKERKAESDAKNEAEGGCAVEATEDEGKKFDDDEFGLQRAQSVDTSLLIYFFGKKGFDQVRV